MDKETYTFDKNLLTAVLEMAVDNAAINRVLLDFLFDQASRGNPTQKSRYYTDLKTLHHQKRAELVRNLYERFGDLPQGLLEDESLGTEGDSG